MSLLSAVETFTRQVLIKNSEIKRSAEVAHAVMMYVYAIDGMQRRRKRAM